MASVSTAGKPRALVIGGSLGGLLTGILLRRSGWDVDVFERVPSELSGRGAGIVTHPELLAALARCGATIDDSIGVEVAARITLDASGRTIGELPLRQIMTSWGRLYALLKACFPADAYHSGFSLERVEQSAGGVVACFANGERLSGELLVGADGIRSTVRAQFVPAVAPQYAGYVAWRGLVEESALSPGTHAVLFDKLAFCLPPGEQMLGYPVAGAANTTRPGHRRYNIVWYRPAAEDSALVDLLTDETGHTHEFAIPPPLIRGELIANLRREADELLAPQFAELVKLTEQPFFQPIYDVECPRLVFDRVVLAGDAGFVARPHVGMGVTKAAGDAVALADALGAEADLKAALARYEAGRVRFGSTVISRARHLGAYMQAQIRTADERRMAERYRTPAAVMGETATPESMWSSVPA
jgi:2-polyprenyl-6-methoxyphenol hydroxylase-like FAD-dependent oxidoreductase